MPISYPIPKVLPRNRKMWTHFKGQFNNADTWKPDNTLSIKFIAKCYISRLVLFGSCEVKYYKKKISSFEKSNYF